MSTERSERSGLEGGRPLVLTEEEQESSSCSPVEVDGDGVVGVEELGSLLNLLLHELVLQQVHNRLCNYRRIFSFFINELYATDVPHEI